MRCFFVGFVAVLCGVSASAAGPTVSLESLLKEMVDRERIARLPAPAFTCRQASSYDRKQTDPQNANTWFANEDYGQFIREETNQGRHEWVVMEHDGPGAVVRMWTPLWPNIDKAIVRFYLDGATEPAIAVNFNDLFSGHALAKPPLSFISWSTTKGDGWAEITKERMRGVGGDCYLPIPFAKGCKMTLDMKPFYYAVNYRCYAPGTRVQSFSMAGLEAARQTIERVSTDLDQFRPILYDNPLAAEKEVPRGGQLSLDLPDGPSAVQLLQVKLPADLALGQLRTTIVEMTFDGEQTVWCPLSEFFGVGLRGGTVRDWYRSAAADGTLECRFLMPYEKSARITLRNVAEKPIKLGLSVAVKSHSWDARSMHFHATWRHQNPLKTRPMSDWNYVDIAGQGVYVGDTLCVWSPVGAWYGEGDERIYVDGQRFPSHLGTGTEDYYGYAWGMADRFDSPFISMPRRDHAGDRNNWVGLTTTSRVRLLDGVPFTKRLKFDMEVWNWADTRMAYAAAAFWYARPGATSNRAPTPDEALRAAADVPPPVPGLYECESLPIVAHSGKLQTSTQSMAGLDWSGEGQLFVQARRVGDFLEMDIPAKDNASQRLLLTLTKSYDYGILRLSVNGQAISPDFDDFGPKPVVAKPLDLGVFTPRDKHFRLRVEVVGANPASRGPKYYFGLDCVRAVKP
jgi:hypothetical protein